MATVDKNIEKAKNILIEYEKAKELTQILELHKMLSLYCVFLGEDLSILKKEYNNSYFFRKIEVSKSYLNNKKKKITDKQSLSEADIENEELYKQESKFEATALRLDIFLRQCNRVLDCMRTDISYLKQEANRITSEDL